MLTLPAAAKAALVVIAVIVGVPFLWVTGVPDVQLLDEVAAQLLSDARRDRVLVEHARSGEVAVLEQHLKKHYADWYLPGLAERLIANSRNLPSG